MPFCQAFRSDVADWAQGRSWIARLPLLVLFLYILVKSLDDPAYASVFAGLNLGLHELGHVVFGLFGTSWNIAGGTLLQCAAPLASIPIFYRQRDFFAITFSCGWLSTNLFGVARYVADARSMAMELVSPFGGDPIHDWNYLLARAGLLSYDALIAWWLRAAAICSMLVGLIYGVWVLRQMRRAPGGS